MKYETLLKLMNSRTSCRCYDEREVPDDLINKCLEAARLAPSACNKQPWRFVVVKDAELRQAICERGLLPGLPMPWTKQAPVIIALCTVKSMVVHTIAPLLSGVNYPLVDAGIAGEHLVLAAASLGLGTCWIGWFREKQVKKILAIPRSTKIVSLFTLGYPAERTEPSKRFSLEEVTFRDQWERSV
ncbi:MAG: nitroreductase family protein [Victivallaceae bacterium]|nr:nitroreductase family protein [Victivallaceae bacterium]